MKRFVKYLLYAIGGVLLLAAIFLGYILIQDRLTMRRIAEEFQIEPSRDAIFMHLFHEEFKPGMTREEIYEVLDRIGTWEVRWYDDPDLFEGLWDARVQQYTYRETILFTNMHTHHCAGYWIFIYNKESMLIDRELLDLGG